MMQFLPVILYIILPGLFATDPLSSNSDSSSPNQVKLIIFLFFFGFFVLLSVAIFIIRKYLKGKANARSSAIQYTEVTGEEPCISINVPSQTKAKNLGSPRPDLLSRLLKNQIDYDDYKHKFEIDPANLQVSKKEHLGEGQFGAVELGKLKNGVGSLKVAVKRSKKSHDPDERELFLAELTVMCALEKHPNLLCLVGGVTSSEPNRIVLEYIEGGDLQQYMVDSRKRFKDIKSWIEADSKTRNSEKFSNQQISLTSDLKGLSTFDLISFAYQIASGMKYLASVPCVHRDLALRNILIDSDGTVRIGDFGLSRKYMDKAYYRPEHEGKEIGRPWLWMAPEAYKMNKFTEKTDIFSYGVCLYELFSLGRDPIVNDIWRPFWEKSEYLPFPDYSTARIYEHMKMCWKTDPNARPNFAWCSDIFKGELKNCSDKIFYDVEGRLENVRQQHRKLESWVANDQSFSE
ncbi:hypothetical protein CAEBREN_12244 [Caenorhabditis brenneri]|uniref:Protein kinase domain-containing protein n=1 Tax=Caenorhabditis brenneri TaxID=135651 RepID=G0NN34_CAEBE|nr:hypothetical protein CAEBREN_12244 [Caenorhabditis brenneri]